MQARLKNLAYYKWLIFGVASTGTFMSTMTSSIVNVGLPPITAALSTDIPTAQWVVTAYLLGITSLLPLMGRLGDVLGRRKMFGYGFIGFTVGSLLCGLANSIGMLIGFRVLQAIGAAALMANSMAIVTSNFPPQERGKVLGMVGTIVALGTLSGPGLGGLLVEHVGWHAIFFVNLPVGLVGYAGVRLILPPDRELRRETIDYWGALLFTVAMISFLLALSYGTEWGWLSLRTLGCAGFALSLFSIFVWYEKRLEQPMLELSIFRNWAFAAGNLAGVFSFMSMFTSTMLLPYFLHDIRFFSPAKTGLIMSAFPLTMAVTAPLSGALSDKTGAAVLTTAGLGVMAAGLWVTANLTTESSLLLIMAGQALMGLGNGMFQSPNNSSVMSALEPKQLGVAGGINALARYFGMVSGTALAVSILEYRRAGALAGTMQPTPFQQTAAFMSGYHDALFAGMCLALLGAVVSCKRVPKRQQAGHEPQ